MEGQGGEMPLQVTFSHPRLVLVRSLSLRWGSMVSSLP